VHLSHLEQHSSTGNSVFLGLTAVNDKSNNTVYAQPMHSVDYY